MKKVSLFLAFVLLGVVNAFAQTGIGSNMEGDERQPPGSFIPAPYRYLAKIHWPHDQEPSLIAENNQTLKVAESADALAKTAGWYYDKATHLLWIKTSYNNREDITLNFK